MVDTSQRELRRKTKTDFDELLNTTLRLGGCPTIEFTLPWHKWQFLCYVADHHDIALHGSGDPNIAMFEPRQANDLTEFGNQKAIYAASDGLWAMFFAIVDRDRVKSITNACVRLKDETGAFHGFDVFDPQILIVQNFRRSQMEALKKYLFQ